MIGIIVLFIVCFIAYTKLTGGQSHIKQEHRNDVLKSIQPSVCNSVGIGGRQSAKKCRMPPNKAKMHLSHREDKN